MNDLTLATLEDGNGGPSSDAADHRAQAPSPLTHHRREDLEQAGKKYFKVYS